jgi:hypothetical protein
MLYIQSPTDFIAWGDFLQKQGPYLVLAVVFAVLLYKLYKQHLDTAQAEAKAARERERQALDEYKQEIKTLSAKREKDLEARTVTADQYAENLRRVADATTRGMEELAANVRTMTREVIQEIRNNK